MVNREDLLYKTNNLKQYDLLLKIFLTVKLHNIILMKIK